MNSITRSLLALAIVATPAALAQKWEFGGGAGGGFYTSQDISAPAGNAVAKFSSNIAAAAWIGNNNGTLFGGELRYDWQKGDAELKSGGTKANFSAVTHSLHYDFLLHFAPRDSAVRPFVAAGGGFKLYQGTGEEVVFQPLNRIGLLTKTTEIKPLVSLGAGIKFKISPGLGLRAEIHDFLSPFPDQVIAPAAGAKVGGWVHDFVVTFGLSILF